MILFFLFASVGLLTVNGEASFKDFTLSHAWMKQGYILCINIYYFFPVHIPYSSHIAELFFFLNNFKQKDDKFIHAKPNPSWPSIIALSNLDLIISFVGYAGSSSWLKHVCAEGRRIELESLEEHIEILSKTKQEKKKIKKRRVCMYARIVRIASITSIYHIYQLLAKEIKQKKIFKINGRVLLTCLLRIAEALACPWGFGIRPRELGLFLSRTAKT